MCTVHLLTHAPDLVGPCIAGPPPALEPPEDPLHRRGPMLTCPLDSQGGVPRLPQALHPPTRLFEYTTDRGQNASVRRIR
jgi:hypothetical protein